MDLFQIHQGKQPVIFLKGVQGSDLETVLQYIYFGEATLYENRMNAFLDVSKILEIEDLFNSISSDEILQHHTVDHFPPDSKMASVKLDKDVEQIPKMKMTDEVLPVIGEKAAQTKSNIVEEQQHSVDDFPLNSKIESVKQYAQKYINIQNDQSTIPCFYRNQEKYLYLEFKTIRKK